MEYQKYFKDKKIFITGHTGFKGSWMLRWMHSLGANIMGYSLNPENEFDLYNIIQGDQLCNSIISDIRDFNRLSTEIERFQPDFIFHLAAQPLVRLSYEIPRETFDVNVIGTVNVLEAIKSIKKSCVCVLITTDKVYENKEWHYPYRESDRLGGYDPYSASKACAEIVISSYRNSFFNIEDFTSHQKAIASARAGNVIGGGDWAKNRIIPDIVKSIQKEEPIEVRNPNAIRPWQHVLEPISGYMMLAAKLSESPVQFSESWNFGPNIEDTYTVKEVVNKAIHIWGKGEFMEMKDKNAPHEAGLLKLDINKSIHKLGWKPKLNSDLAIQWTMEYYKSENELECMDRQIKEYQAL